MLNCNGSLALTSPRLVVITTPVSQFLAPQALSGRAKKLGCWCRTMVSHGAGICKEDEAHSSHLADFNKYFPTNGDEDEAKHRM